MMDRDHPVRDFKSLYEREKKDNFADFGLA